MQNFLERLSEVCEWEWYDFDTHKRSKHSEGNVYPRVVSYPNTCKYLPANKKTCSIKIEKKRLDNKVFWYERCSACKKTTNKHGEWIGNYSGYSVQFVRENILPD
jgi:hypothetical protein